MDERVSFDSSIKQTALRGGETAVLSKINKQANQSLELHYKIQSRGEKIKTKQNPPKKNTHKYLVEWSCSFLKTCMSVGFFIQLF